MRAKSRPRKDPERLTTHSRAVHQAVGQIQQRIGSPGILAAAARFWAQVEAAGLLHDAGKIAEGFRQQLLGGVRWGERHEVLSLAYVDLLAAPAGWSASDRIMIATLVATHHRALFRQHSSTGKRSLTEDYNAHTDWAQAFTCRTYLGQEQIQVPRALHRELLAWYAGALGVDPPPADGPSLAERARSLFTELATTWRTPASADDGLLAVLGQGALTWADHAGSAHIALQSHLPLPLNYLEQLPHAPYPHQKQAAETDGHMILIAPTGSGKTEGGLAWAARQITDMPAQPRLVWALPYRASLNAAADRFATRLIPLPGQKRADIGILHGTIAQTLLAQAVDDDTGTSGTATAALARQARARANAMRLFAQRVRVATPHQLLRGAIAGPARSATLLEQANSVFVLDELHAYDPDTFGRLCASMRLWERLGSRTAVLSATLAPPMIDLIRDSLIQPVTLHAAPPGTSPDRHRLILDDTPLTDRASVKQLRAWLEDGYSVLVVTNTVATAQRLFGQLAATARAARPTDRDAALLLHSLFKNRDRAAIEARLLDRHPERTPGEPRHRGGLAVCTQAVEVSLQLDFDRGAVEAAPVEAVAQRAGRVNRRGLHPEGPVDFRVHRPFTHHPYEKDAVDAAWGALTTLVEEGAVSLSEQDIDRLLALAYDTDWGKAWAQRARAARDMFARHFLTFTEPFHDRTEFAEELDKELDSTEILHIDDVDEYQRLTNEDSGDPLLAAGLLIPIRERQQEKLHAAYLGDVDPNLGIFVTSAPYDPSLGLKLPTN